MMVQKWAEIEPSHCEVLLWYTNVFFGGMQLVERIV